ncbi:MAG: M20/M25/M40 family metallo-hydrolase, partial [Spirochaetaceae bacterium]
PDRLNGRPPCESSQQAAARGCAQALGVEIKVDISPGYLPVCTNPTLHQLANETADEMGIGFEESDFGAASSDVGDISQKIPSIIIGLPGTNGRFHHPDFRVVDEDLAFQFPPDFIRRYLAKILSNLSLLVDSH